MLFLTHYFDVLVALNEVVFISLVQISSNQLRLRSHQNFYEIFTRKPID